jgi:CRISPR/Cas system-associated exonuclease Cas4 (RecB family)
MKNILLAFVLLVSSLAVNAEEKNVNEKVLNAFKNEFTTASQVEWSTGLNYYKASFVFNDKHVYAFYNADGRLLGLTRNITTSELPLKLQTDLKKNYENYWISDLFEAAREEGTSYYLTLEDADTRLVLKASADNNWTVYEKTKKS